MIERGHVTNFQVIVNLVGPQWLLCASHKLVMQSFVYDFALIPSLGGLKRMPRTYKGEVRTG